MKTKQKLRRAATSGTRFSAALVRAAEAGGGTIGLFAVARALVAEMAIAAEEKLSPPAASLLISRTLMAALAEQPPRPFAPLVRSQHLLSPADAESFCHLLTAKLVDPTPGKVKDGDDPLVVASVRLVEELRKSAVAESAAAESDAAAEPAASSSAEPAMNLIDAPPASSAQIDEPAAEPAAKKTATKVVTARELIPALLTYARGTAGLEFASEHLIAELDAATGGRPLFAFDAECAGIVGTVAGLAAALDELAAAAVASSSE